MAHRRRRRKEIAWEVEEEAVTYREAEAHLRRAYRILRAPPVTNGSSLRDASFESKDRSCAGNMPLLRVAGA